MVLSSSQIRKFQAIYLKTYGKRISREEAYNMGINLLNMIKIIHNPINKADYDDPENDV